MAHGGEVSSFCSSGGSHRRECKYYAPGGDVHLADIPVHENTEEAISSYLMHGGLHHLLKAEPQDVYEALDHYNGHVSRGHKLSEKTIGALFGGNSPDEKDHTKSKEAIDAWVSRGAVTDDLKNEIYKDHEVHNFASGGEAKMPAGIGHKHHLANIYPDHNIALQAAKGRVGNYLNSLRPQPHSPKLAFDDEPDNTKQNKDYRAALHIAAHPLSVLEEAKKGTIEPEHVSHLRQMYPEVNNSIQKRVTNKIVDDQLNHRKPPYHIRQGLSMLLGTPLSGEMAPQNIMAAQATFQAKKATQPEGGQPQKKTSALAKTNQSYLLPNQAAAERQQKQ